jgi:hypothetical protein
MANYIKEQRLIDNNKRALLKYVFIGDGTQEANTTLVDVSTLANALNTSGQIMTSNTNPKPKYTTTIKRIWGRYTGDGYIKLQWQGATNSEITVFGSGTVNIDFESRADVAVISNPEAETNGDILISTVGVKTANVFTLFVDLRKDSADYDAGQTRDPVAFNRGPAAP